MCHLWLLHSSVFISEWRKEEGLMGRGRDGGRSEIWVAVTKFTKISLNSYNYNKLRCLNTEIKLP